MNSVNFEGRMFMNSFKKYLAEFFGTCVLVVFGCGTAMLVGCDAASGCGYILTAFAFGLVIVAMAYSIGNVSGCHINPAVSIGFLVAGKMKLKDFIGYVVAQFIGALFGTLILYIIFDLSGLTDQTGAFGSNALLHDAVGLSFFIEVILTFVFVLVILSVTSKEKNDAVAGIVIGLTLTLVHILGIGLTGTSVNPARSFGPAVFAGGSSLMCLPVFIVAPLVGGVLAALAYKFGKAKEE